MAASERESETQQQRAEEEYSRALSRLQEDAARLSGDRAAEKVSKVRALTYFTVSPTQPCCCAVRTAVSTFRGDRLLHHSSVPQ
jgi:hypothetical protein